MAHQRLSDELKLWVWGYARSLDSKAKASLSRMERAFSCLLKADSKCIHGYSHVFSFNKPNYKPSFKKWFNNTFSVTWSNNKYVLIPYSEKIILRGLCGLYSLSITQFCWDCATYCLVLLVLLMKELKIVRKRKWESLLRAHPLTHPWVQGSSFHDRKQRELM